MKCLHCGNESATRSRGLGNRCYANRAVRESYPPRGGFGRAGARGAEAEPTMAELERIIAEEYPTMPGRLEPVEFHAPSTPRLLMRIVKTGRRS